MYLWQHVLFLDPHPESTTHQSWEPCSQHIVQRAQSDVTSKQHTVCRLMYPYLWPTPTSGVLASSSKLANDWQDMTGMLITSDYIPVAAWAALQSDSVTAHTMIHHTSQGQTVRVWRIKADPTTTTTVRYICAVSTLRNAFWKSAFIHSSDTL